MQIHYPYEYANGSYNLKKLILNYDSQWLSQIGALIIYVHTIAKDVTVSGKKPGCNPTFGLSIRHVLIMNEVVTCKK